MQKSRSCTAIPHYVSDQYSVEYAVELTENQRRNSLLHQKEILNEVLCLIHLEFIFPQRQE